MKKIARLGLLLPVAALSLLAQGPPKGEFGGGPGFGGPGMPGMGRHQQIVTGAPFSGTLTEQRQQTLQDGNQISTSAEIKLYRDTQGRVRTEMTRTRKDGQTKTFISIFDPVAGFEARLNPDKSTAEKHSLPAQSGGERRMPQPPAGEQKPQIATSDLGSKTIEGLAATGKQITVTIPPGEMGNAEAIQTVREAWTSTALKIPVLVTVTDPRFGNSKTQLTSVTQSEPDASLFQIPSNYKVSTAPMGRHGGPPPAAE